MDTKQVKQNTKQKHVLHNLAVPINFFFVDNKISHFIIHVIFTNIIFICLLILLDYILLIGL
jgi:hypothetical protein